MAPDTESMFFGQFGLRRFLVLSALLMPWVLAGCGEDPFLFRWTENPREAMLYSLDRPERNRPSAFEMLSGERVVLESAAASGRWDFALSFQNGELVFLPPRAVGVQSGAGIVAYPNTRFDELRTAPSDTTLFVTDAPVPVRMGSTYVVRTREQTGFYGERCRYYGKVQPLEVDLAQRTLLFRFDTSPDCNNPSLVPPGA
jgi:hypothetical protein